MRARHLVGVVVLSTIAMIASCGQSAFAERVMPMAGTVQEADTGTLTALQQAGWHVESHEFNVDTEGKVTATQASGSSIKVSYRPRGRGDVWIEARAAGASEQECAAVAEQVLMAIEAAITAERAK